jgi:hypothetical protein
MGDEHKEQRPMRDEWYVARRGQDGNKRYGPVPLHQLRELVDGGRVQPDDLVWREGMGEWQRADQCESLFPPAAPRREPRDYPPEGRGGYDRGRGPRSYDRDDYDGRPYRRRYPQQQSSSGWAVPLAIGGVVIAFCFLTCGGLAAVASFGARSSSSSYQPYYSTPISDPAPVDWQDPPPPAFDPNQNQWQPPAGPDQPFVPNPGPPVFVPDPNPIFVPDPNPNPIFVPDPNPNPVSDPDAPVIDDPDGQR